MSAHEQALCKPQPYERHLVCIMVTIDNLIDHGYAEQDDGVRNAVRHLIAGLSELIQYRTDRLDYDELQAFIDHARREVGDQEE